MAATWMPVDRREWGSAMGAELAHVEGGAARWRFAGGCLRVALRPRRPRSRGFALGTIVAVAVILFSLANGPGPAKSGRWIAGNLLFVLTLYGLYLAKGIATRPRSPAPPSALPAPAGVPVGGRLRAVIVFGVAAAAVLDAFVLAWYPELRSQGNAGLAGYIATAVVTVAVGAVLSTYAWLAVVRTRARSEAAVVARRYGLVAGAIAGPLLVAASYPPAPVPTVLVVAGAGVCSAVAGHLASRAGGEARAGLVAGIWAGVVAGLTLFVLGAVVILVTGGAAHSATTIANFHASKFHDLRSFTVAGNFGLDGDPPLVGALVPLVFVPLFCAGLAAIGATGSDRGLTWREPLPGPPA